MTFSFIYLHIV